MYDPKNPQINKPKDSIAVVTIPEFSTGKGFPQMQNSSLTIAKTNNTNTSKNATKAINPNQIMEQNYQIALEPQRIRMFKIKYILPEDLLAAS